MSLAEFKFPWDDSKKWIFGYWYPVPVNHDIEYKKKEFTVPADRWDLYTLSHAHGHELAGDITPMGIDVGFIACVKIANTLNPTKLWTASWIEADWARP